MHSGDEVLVPQKKTAKDINDDVSVMLEEKHSSYSTFNIITLSIVKFRKCKPTTLSV